MLNYKSAAEFQFSCKCGLLVLDPGHASSRQCHQCVVDMQHVERLHWLSPSPDMLGSDYQMLDGCHRS